MIMNGTRPAPSETPKGGMRMLRISMIVGALAAGTLGSGCVVHGRAGMTATATYSEPELVYVSPGVYVVADQTEPTFYSDGAYWLYRGGIWYRSGYYSGGWV